jgi:hypothetical protein
MVCGSNPFFGFSHFSAARDRWLQRYFTVERIVEVLHACSEYGINGVVSGTVPEMHQAIVSLEEQTGHHVNWFCTPCGDTLEQLLEGAKWCADHGAEYCLPHQNYTDNRMNVARRKIEGLEVFCDRVRELGMIPGLSTHRHETVRVADEGGYDIETYIQIYNAIGFLCQVETDWVQRVIQDARKPVLCIKPLASGRVMPPTGLSFVYRTIRPIDTVALGFLSVDEVEEDCKIALNILQDLQAEVPLQYTRSKQELVR